MSSIGWHYRLFRFRTDEPIVAPCTTFVLVLLGSFICCIALYAALSVINIFFGYYS